jgi:hypothetical protein
VERVIVVREALLLGCFEAVSTSLAWAGRGVDVQINEVLSNFSVVA